MAITQETVVLHGPYQARIRTSSRGTKQRVSIDTKSEALLFEFNDHLLGQGPAEAITKVYRAAIEKISAVVSPETVARRERAQRNQNSAWWQRRYGATRNKSGALRKGGMPETPPIVGSTQWGNDSRRLAHGLKTRENRTEGSWTTNVPVARLNQDTFGDGFLAFLEKLARLAPVIGDARRLMAEREVMAAIEDGIEYLIQKADNETQLRLKKLRNARRAALFALARAGATIMTP